MKSENEYRTIKELCSVVSDCPHSSPTWTNSGKIVVRNNNIKNGWIDLSSPSYTDDEHFQQRIKRAVPQPGDIIITREAPIGEVGMIPENIECCLGQRMVLLRADPIVCNNYFLLYSLQSRYVQHQISWSEGTGTTVSNLRIPHLENLKIPYISLDKQQKVVSILKVLEDKIVTNKRISENLERQAQAIFKSWFEDFAPFKSTRPDEWESVSLSDCCSLISRGITPKYDELSEQIVINQKCIRDHQLNLIQARRHIPKTINEKWLQYGDVLINSTGQGTLGRIAQVLFEPKNLTVDSHVTIVRPNSGLLICYIGCLLMGHELDFVAMERGSTGQTELPRELVQSYEILRPDEETLIKFNAVVKPLFDLIVSNQNENGKLALLRDTLLPKLMAGEIEV